LEAIKQPYIAYTYAANATKRTADKGYLRAGYPQRYINERAFDPERIELAADSLVFCMDWTKDFFHYTRPACPVYHIHPSLLPSYRGYGAISEQFIKGAAISGLTLYKDEQTGIDSGDILYQEAIRIEHNDWPEDFIAKASKIAAIWIAAMTSMAAMPSPTPQAELSAFHVQRKRTKQGLLDFNLNALSVYNHIRAYSRPFFGAYFLHNGEQIKVWRASCEKWSGIYGKPGEIINKSKAGVEIACGEGSIVLIEIENSRGTQQYDMIEY
jgi:methionyl-tRNA formyltransferase